jgi:hypothetical protein
VVVGGIELSDAGARERVLACGPAGTWQSLRGSARILGFDEVCFGADGYGTVQRYSGMGDSLLRFRWRLQGPGVLELQGLSVSEPDSEDGGWRQCRSISSREPPM